MGSIAAGMDDVIVSLHPRTRHHIPTSMDSPFILVDMFHCWYK
jgi:hypothetical protein